MKNTSGPIFFSMILVTVLIFFLLFSIYGKQTIEENDNNSSNNSSSKEEVTAYSWNGIYSKEDNSLSLSIYQVNNSKIAIVNKSNGTLIFFADIKSTNIFTFEYNNIEYTITNLNQSFAITSSSSNSLSGNYTFINSYYQSDYYEDTFGQESYLASEWNGVYVYNEFTMKIYQLDKEKFVILITNSDQSVNYKQTLLLSNSSLNYSDENSSIKLSYSGSNLVLNSTSTISTNVENKITGIYTKSAAYSYEDIISDNY